MKDKTKAHKVKPLFYRKKKKVSFVNKYKMEHEMAKDNNSSLKALLPLIKALAKQAAYEACSKEAVNDNRK